MGRKAPKIDTSPAPNPLQDTPFARLLGAASAEYPESGPQAGDSATTMPLNASHSQPYFTIARTKKGGFPIRIEKRGGGKCVTIAERLAGDLPRLLKELRKLCGCGGALRGDAIELQGDHRGILEVFFREHS